MSTFLRQTNSAMRGREFLMGAAFDDDFIKSAGNLVGVVQ